MNILDIVDQTLTPAIGWILLLITVITDLFLAILVFRSNTKSATNKIFSLLCSFIILWLSTTFIFYFPTLAALALGAVRLGIFFAAPISALFFLLAHTLPHERLRMNKRIFWITILVSVMMMIVNISPYAFTEAKIVGDKLSTEAGPGIIPFSTFSTIFSILALFSLIKKFKATEGIERKQLRLVLLGALIMLTLVIFTVLLPIIVWESGVFVPLLPLYTLIFLGMTAYAIVQHRLFNIKVVVTEAITVVIWIVLFAKMLASESTAARITDGLIFIFTVIFGILLVKAVRKEIEQRERLEVLTKELQTAYDKLKELDQLKTEFLGFAAHQVKGPMVVVKDFAQLIADGTYGQASDKIKETVGKIKDSADRLIALVNNLLDLRKIEAGEFLQDIKFEELDIVAFLSSMVEEYEIIATKKNLALSFESAVPSLKIKADSQKIRQVVQNILDNALKYTDQGYVKVSVKDESSTPSGQPLVASGSVLITVSDSGHGLSKKLQAKLFQRFVRDEQTKREIEGTGLGLYLAKEIVTAHHGEIWAESDGEGKGSRFYVRLGKQ